MQTDRTRVAHRTTAINLVALAVALGWYGLIGTTLTLDSNDFGIYRKGVVSLGQSGDPYLPISGQNTETAIENDYIYPPLLAYLLQPFGLLDERSAQLLWFGLNGLMLGGLIALSIWLSDSELARRYWGLVALGTLIAPPTRLGLQLGQIGILLALMILGSLALARRNAPLSGFLLALASLIKLYPAFLGLYLALRRLKRELWWSVVAALVICGVSILVYGLTPYLTYIQRLREANYFPYGAEFNTSVYGFWYRLFVPNHFGIVVADLPQLAALLALASSFAVIGLCFWAGMQAGSHLEAQLQQGVWLCAMLLLSPLNGVYNLVLLLLPALVMLRYLEQSPDRAVRNWLVFATILIWVRPLWSTWWPRLDNFVHIGWGLILLTPPFYGLLIYLALLVILARRLRGAQLARPLLIPSGEHPAAHRTLADDARARS
jgi:alpha-1,2-mannosyltransferase